MQSEDNNFINFIHWILNEGILKQEAIDMALEDIDGVEGVIKDNLYVSGYELIGHYISDHLDFQKIKHIFSIGKDMFKIDSATRYYFIEAIIQDNKFTIDQKNILINLSPDDYKQYLCRHR